MSTTLISFNWSVGNPGVLTDVTACVFNDPTSAYGIRRTDNNAIIEAAGVALNHDSTGRYSFSFTDPAPNLIYSVWIQWVYLGNTYREQRLVYGGTSGPSLNSTYTLADVRTFTRMFMRNGGSDPASYSPTMLDFCLQQRADELIRECRLLPVINALTLTQGSNTLPAMPSNFRTERVINSYLSSSNVQVNAGYLDPNYPYYSIGAPAYTDLVPTSSSIKIVPMPTLIDYKQVSVAVGQPTLAAFDQRTGSGLCFPTPDQNYTWTLKWLDLFTPFTAGQSDDTITFNLPNDYMRAIFSWGIPSLAQGNEPQNSFQQTTQVKWDSFVASMRGQGNLGENAIPIASTGAMAIGMSGVW